MHDEDIIKDIKKYNKKIIKILISGKPSHFEKYIHIKQGFKKNIGNEFKKLFCDFYGLDDRKMNSRQKEKYFAILSNKKKNLRKILLSLQEVRGYNNRQSLYLSYATKLIHTLDNDLPIYDGNINKIFVLPRQIYGTSIKNETKIKNRLNIYDELKGRFDVLLNNKEIKKILKKKRDYFHKKSYWQDDLITDTKLLDSILWALHTVIIRNK